MRSRTSTELFRCCDSAMMTKVEIEAAMLAPFLKAVSPPRADGHPGCKFLDSLLRNTN